MRGLVRREGAESGQKSPKSVISWQAVQSVVNRIGGAGEGRRESRSVRLGAAIGHPNPQDAAVAIRVGKSARRIRPARRPGGGAGGRAFRRRALGAARRFADSEPPVPLRRVCAALSGSDRRRGCDRSQSAPSGRAGGVRGGVRRRLTDSRRAGANRSASAWDGRARPDLGRTVVQTHVWKFARRDPPQLQSSRRSPQRSAADGATRSRPFRPNAASGG